MFRRNENKETNCLREIVKIISIKNKNVNKLLLKPLKIYIITVNTIHIYSNLTNFSSFMLLLFLIENMLKRNE